MKPKILSFASINIDEVYSVPHITRPGETLLSTHRQLNAGGKGANASVAAARAGASVYVAGKIGRDGLWVRDLIASAGASVGLIGVLDDVATGRAVIQVDSSGENSIFLYPGANHMLTKGDAHRAFGQFNEGDWLMLPNETTAVADAIRLAHERRLQVIWNPAPMSPDLAANYPVALVDVLVVNETELVGLAQQIDGIQLPKDKKKHEYTAVARQVMKRLGSRVIIVTLGRDGSIGLVHKFKSNMHSLPVAGSNAASERLKASVIADEDIAEIHVDCSPVGADQVRDTTAAGDTWIGYFTAELARMQGASPESIGSHAALTPAMVQRAMTFATYASGIAITRMGAVPSIPERKDVEAFFKSKAIP